MKALSPEVREQINGIKEFHGDYFASDVYSFGLVLLETLLLKDLDFLADLDLALMDRHNQV